MKTNKHQTKDVGLQTVNSLLVFIKKRLSHKVQTLYISEISFNIFPHQKRKQVRQYSTRKTNKSHTIIRN